MKNFNKYSVQEVMNSTVYDSIKNADFTHATDATQTITPPNNCHYLKIISPFDFYWATTEAVAVDTANEDRHVGVANIPEVIGPFLSAPIAAVYFINKTAAAGDAEEVNVQCYI
jgi:hypothetical protein